MAVYSLRRIVLESYPLLLACGVISLAAGYLLNVYAEKLVLIPLILMMVPPLNGLGGNVGSILGARLTSALHLGTIESKFARQKILDQNLAASALMGLGAFTFAGAVFFAVAWGFGSPLIDSVKLSLAFFMAGAMLSAVVVFVTVASAFISFRKGLDPDNIVIPIVTSIGDVSGIMCLIIAIQIMGV